MWLDINRKKKPWCFACCCFKGFCLYDLTSSFSTESPLFTEMRLRRDEHIQLSLWFQALFISLPKTRRHVGSLSRVFKKHFKCSPASFGEFPDFDVPRYKIIYVIYKWQKAVLMCYLPFSKPNADLLFEMSPPAVSSRNTTVATGHFNIGHSQVFD